MAPALTAVIGAHFGDEGKGLLTDRLVADQAAGADAPPLVVRINGGAQAGHTVTRPDGFRHVFGHVGAGTLAGAATGLSRFFVVNPLLLIRELDELAGKGVTPRLSVDPRCPVTLPFDMMINRAAEAARGTGRHGSCGVGFGETLERGEDPRFALRVADLADRSALADRLDHIRRDWVPARLARLGIDPAADPAAAAELAYLDDPGVEARFLGDIARMADAVTVEDVARRAAAAPAVITEGAQGLLLDQDHPWFPYVTRSHTGLRNVVAFARDAGCELARVVYVTRGYLTRHGAGPLPGELPRPPCRRFADPTNRPNPWQGALRFAYLDPDLFARTVRADLAHLPAGAAPDLAVAVTCLDQFAGDPIPLAGAPTRPVAAEQLIRALAAAIGATAALRSDGPCREQVSRVAATGDRDPVPGQ